MKGTEKHGDYFVLEGNTHRRNSLCIYEFCVSVVKHNHGDMKGTEKHGDYFVLEGNTPSPKLPLRDLCVSVVKT